MRRPAIVAPVLDREVLALSGAVADLVRLYPFRDRDQVTCCGVSVTPCHALEALVVQGPLRAHPG